MAEVTKRHRELAYTAARDLAVPPEDSPADRWVETGNGEPPGVWLRIAEALADIEAAALATRASAVESGEGEHLEEGARQACPDCNKRYMRNYLDHKGCDRIRHRSACAELTIARLRTENARLLAELEAARSEIRDLETQVFELQMGDDL